MTQKQILPVRFTGEKELELYNFLRKESFDTGLAMAEIARRGIELYKSQKEEEKMKGAHDYTYVLVTQTQLMHPELDDSEELTEGEAINLIRDFDGVETNKGIWAFPDGSQLYRKGGAK